MDLKWGRLVKAAMPIKEIPTFPSFIKKDITGEAEQE